MADQAYSRRHGKQLITDHSCSDFNYDTASSARHRGRRAVRQATQRCLIEGLEERRLMAVFNVQIGGSELNFAPTGAISPSSGTISLSASQVEASSWTAAAEAVISGSATSSVNNLTYDLWDPSAFKIGLASDFVSGIGGGKLKSTQQVIGFEDQYGDNDFNDDYWVINVTEVKPQAPYYNPDSTDSNGVPKPDTGDQEGTPDKTADPISYATGNPSISLPGLQSQGFGIQSNTSGRLESIAGTGTGLSPGFGTAHFTVPEAYLTQSSTNGFIFTLHYANGRDIRALTFDSLISQSGTDYIVGTSFHDKDTLEITSTEITWTDETGSQMTFYASGPRLGKLKQKLGRVNTFGDQNYTYDNSTDQVTQVSRTNGTVSESYNYTYIPTSSPNAGAVAGTSLNRNDSVVPERNLVYEYYEAGDSGGYAGAVKRVITQDASGNTLNQTYYRYWTQESVTVNGHSGHDLPTNGYVGAIKYVISDASYDRLAAAVGDSEDIEAASDATIAQYANSYYEYDSDQRVTLQKLAGFGNSQTTGGLGTTEFTYFTSSNADGFNSWKTETLEDVDGGVHSAVFCNAYGQVMLKATAVGGGYACDFYKYDSEGRVIMHANASAVTGYPALFADYADLLHFQSTTGKYEFLNDNTGLIENYSYYDSTDVPNGQIEGYKEAYSIQQGETGTPITQETWTYSQSPAGRAMVATDTTYRNTNETGGQTTSYAYTWYSGTDQYESVAITHDAATTSQHGPGGTVSEKTYYDQYNRETWHRDADGFISYKGYDLGTGAVTINIADVNTALDTNDDGNDSEGDGTFSDLPSDFATPTGGGQHLVTRREVDGQGRTWKLTNPKGNITYTWYNDVNHETGTFQSNDGTTVVGPVSIAREYRPAEGSSGVVYSENLTTSAAPVFTDDKPTGISTLSSSNIQSLTRSLTNAAGQTTEIDRYFSLSGITYSVSSAKLGTATDDSGSSGRYHATLQDYDAMGRLSRTQSPSGTIKRTVYDGRGLVLSTWEGTDDTPNMFAWSPDNLVGTNLQKLTENEYDYGNIGDGNLTKVSTYPGGVTEYPPPVGAVRIEYMHYDWRNRLVAEKSSSFPMSLSVADSPWTYYDYDNLNEVISTSQYNSLAPQITSSAPSITNGGFESPALSANTYQFRPTGGTWSYTSNAGIARSGSDYGPTDVTEGNQVAFMQDGGTMSQSVANWGVGTYTISLSAAARIAPLTLEVSVGSTVVGTFTPDNHGEYTLYTTNPFPISSAGTKTVTIHATAPNTVDYGAFIDAVTINVLRSTTTTQYDEQGRVYAQQQFGAGATTGTISSHSLNTDYWYDGRGNLIKSVAPGGTVSKSVYDGIGRTIKTYVTDGGDDSTYSDANDVVGDVVLTQAEYTYDAAGNVTTVITRQRYDNSGTGELGDVDTSPNARVNFTNNYYDSANRLIKSVNVGTSGSGSMPRYATATDTGSTNTLIDSTLTGTYTGKVLTIIDGLGAGQHAVIGSQDADTLTFESSLTVAPDITSAYVISDYVQLTTYEYNLAGQVAVVTDPAGRQTKTTYDLLGRTKSSIANYVDGTPSAADDQTTAYTYTGVDNVLTMTAVVPGNDQVTKYVYGGFSGSNEFASDSYSNDILSAIWYPDPTTGAATNSSQKELFNVNALGQRKNYTDRNGNLHTYKYDGLGRLASDTLTTLGSGVDESIRRIEYSYNSIGAVFQITSYSAATGGTIVNQVRREYNGLGQLIKEYQATGGPVSTSSPVTPSVQYAYSEMASGANHSRLKSITYPNGRIVHYEYGTSGGLNDVISRLSYIADDLSGSAGTHLEEYTYLGLDTVVKRAHPDVSLNMTYGSSSDGYDGLDGFGRVVNQRWTAGSTNVGGNEYTYDADGNRLSHGSAGSVGEVYTYDGLNRLSSYSRGTLNSTKDGFTDTPTSKDWTLDATGNWTNVTGEGSNRAHNDQNQATLVGGNALTYDANGNMLSDDRAQTFVYDGWNRLVKVSNTGGSAPISTYSYDGAGRRVTEKKSGDPAFHFFDALNYTGETLPTYMTAVNGVMYFAYDDQGGMGEALWKSDGTLAGTQKVNQFSYDLAPTLLTNVNGTLYFVGYSSDKGRELWKSNGTDSGTVRVTDIAPNAASAGITSIFAIGSRVYFLANDGTHGNQLWTTDGTTTICLGTTDPGNFTNVNGTLFFAASDSATGRELWKSDGTVTGTVLVKDVNPDAGSSNPESLVNMNGVLYYAATDGTSAGVELWRSDGTSTNTYMLKDINSSGSSSPQILAVIGSWFYFAADDGTNGRELWKSNGGSFNTTLVVDINSGSGSGIGSAVPSVTANGRFFFPANDGTNGTELWSSDGTSSGTVMARNIRSGATSSTITNLTAVDGMVYFTTNDGTHGEELWRSDGTTAGTSMVSDIEPGSDGSHPASLAAVNGQLFFSGNRYGASMLMSVDTRPVSLYYSDQWQVLEERTATGDTIDQYVWSPVYVDAMVLRDRDPELDGTFNERLYAIQDAQWNVTHLFNGSTNVEGFLYDPYGNRTGETSVNWNYFFQGGRFDVATGLGNFRNRDYSPSLGRFVEVDPIGSPNQSGPSLAPIVADAQNRAITQTAYRLGSAYGDTQSLWSFANGMNSYQFVDGNPMTGADPSGLDRYVGSDRYLHGWIAVDEWTWSGSYWSKTAIWKYDFGPGIHPSDRGSINPLLWWGFVVPIGGLGDLTIGGPGRVERLNIGKKISGASGLDDTIPSIPQADIALKEALDKQVARPPTYAAGFFNCFTFVLLWEFYGIEETANLTKIGVIHP